MILFWLISIPVLGGLAALLAGKKHESFARWISLTCLICDFAIVLWLWLNFAGKSPAAQWYIDLNRSWIPRFGIGFHLAMDGLSLLMAALTVFLGIVAVLASWNEIRERVGFFYFNLLWILAGILGVFLAMDLFLFYFFWEIMLIPMYFLIGIWGHEKRIYASFKFFIFTQASGLLMLLAILGLYFIHGRQTGIYTFDYMHLLGTAVPPAAATWLMLGFLIAFLVKLPVVPLHTWLPDAHSEAPTAGSIILAGLLLKTGAYGLLRFVLPLFPDAARAFAPVAMALAVVGILYGAKLAFAQNDLKRLIAYTSVSHMGFVLLGVFAFNELALQGVVMQIICHGISTGALFALAGALYQRTHTRDMNRMGGLWEQVPRMGAIGMVFAMASLGLPGLGNFVAEFLVLAGSYQASIFWTALATVGLVFATVYSLEFIKRVFQGKKQETWAVSDLYPREMVMMGMLVIAIIWLGFYPRPVLSIARPAVEQTLQVMQQADKTVPMTEAHHE